MLMFKDDGGFCDFPEEQAREARRKGWIDGQPVWDAAMAAKGVKVETPIAKPVETVTLTAQSETRRPGRPRNVAPSILNDNDGVL